MQFKDRKPTLLNRFKVTPESGSAYYVTIERADEPTEEGTPLNAENLNKIVTAVENAQKTADNHANNKSNPHGVTVAQIGAGTFAGQIVANSGGQAVGTSLLRNSKLVQKDTNPDYNGEICWTYE